MYRRAIRGHPQVTKAGVAVTAAFAMAIAMVIGIAPAVGASSGPPKLSSLKGSTLVVTSWGGVWTSSEQKYLYGPFTKDTGIKVKVVVNGSNPLIPAMLQEQQGNVSIDIAESLDWLVAYDKGYVQKFPSWLLSIFKKNLNATTYTKYYLTAGNTADVIACNPAVMKKCPVTPAEFFTLKNYPGPRAIATGPTQALPFALEAAGVSTSKKMFPLDVTKALNELKKIKPDVVVWPSSGSQQQQVIDDKEVGAEYMWNGRAYVTKQQNIHNLVISWNGAIMPTSNGYIVMKNAPNENAAFEYFAWLAQHPKNEADWTKALTYPMPSKVLSKYLPKALAEQLPASHPQLLRTSNAYWAKNYTNLSKIWTTFLAG